LRYADRLTNGAKVQLPKAAGNGPAASRAAKGAAAQGAAARTSAAH
jgi:hypothetical protein